MATDVGEVEAERVDVLIVGAGLSGIGAAYRLQTECPGKTYAILEGRSDLGGTWDLFRYPGIRSDSDMFTLGFSFRPWTDAKSIADGPSILQYIRDTSAAYGIDAHIRYDQKVLSAEWSTETATWTVTAEVGGERVVVRAGFLYMCSGYYSYEGGYQPEFPGRERFGGAFVHPQFWPEGLDYAGKRVVVIGSGATAVTVVPAMAETAAHVTMLQRSPTYIVSVPAKDPIADWLRAHLPERAAHGLARWKNVAMSTVFFQFCRRQPERAKALIAKGVRSALPDHEIDPHFVPTYNPWDQRMCLVPNGDLFEAIKAGKASVVTDRIASLTERGIELESGGELEADVIVSATGLELVACGGVELVVDGELVEPGKALTYKGFMLSDVPNLGMAVGYTNASWTLRADLNSRSVCRLLNYMDKHGFDYGVPVPQGAGAVPLGFFDLTSGYISRALDHMPKQGSKSPWKVRQNYVLDLLAMKFGDVTASMRFGRVRGSLGRRGGSDGAGGASPKESVAA